MKFNFKPMTLLAVLTLSLSLASCSSTKKKEVNDNQTMESVGTDASTLELNADSDSGKAGPIKTVFFGFNSSVLSSSARETLNANAEFLKSNPSVEIQVEGHCDERGGVQYNLALGERRAVSVKEHLIAMGVNSSRISTVSFGKERPVAFGHDESAWASNRRGNFIITAK